MFLTIILEVKTLLNYEHFLTYFFTLADEKRMLSVYMLNTGDREITIKSIKVEKKKVKREEPLEIQLTQTKVPTSKQQFVLVANVTFNRKF